MKTLLLCAFALLAVGCSKNYHRLGGPGTTAGGGGTTVQLTSYGGVCNGIADTTRAFKAAFADARNHPLPVTIQIPNSTCALSTWETSNYTQCENLYIPNHVYIQGTGPNSKLKSMHYPSSRVSCGGNWVVTVDFNLHYRTYNCGGVGYGGNCPGTCNTPNPWPYVPTQQATAGTNTIVLVNASDASKFTVGHYVTLFERDLFYCGPNPGPRGGTLSGCDVCPQQPNKITAINVSGATATITVRDSWDRTFAVYPPLNPVIADVDILTRYDAGLSNLTVEGVDPFLMNQVMDLTFKNVNFNVVIDATSDDGSARYHALLDSNTINQITMNNVNIVPLCSSVPALYGDGEWFQANSGHWTWTNSTIGTPTCPIPGIGNSELGRYNNVNHNTFYIAARSGQSSSIAFDSLGEIFDHNIINQVSGDYNGINAGVFLDFIQVCNDPQLILGCTSAYNFNYNITNNTFNGCSASGGACLFLDGGGDVVTGNTFHLVGGNATRGIQLYYHPGDFHINNNNFPGPANNYAIQGNLSNNGWEFIGNTGANQGVAFYNNSTGTCTVQNNSTFGSYSITKGTPGNLCSISNNN